MSYFYTKISESTVYFISSQNNISVFDIICWKESSTDQLVVLYNFSSGNSISIDIRKRILILIDILRTKLFIITKIDEF